MKLNKLIILVAALPLCACGNGGKPNPSSLSTPLSFTCTSDSPGILGIVHENTLLDKNFSLEYSNNNKDWKNVDFTGDFSPFILNKGETIYFRGDNPDGFTHVVLEDGEIIGGCYTAFTGVDGSFNIEGNVMSLLASKDFDKLDTIPNEYCFASLFSLFNDEEDGQFTVYSYPNHLVDASNLQLPATKLTNYCYYRMFAEDIYLTVAPTLPATNLATSCYEKMFYHYRDLKKLIVMFKEDSFIGTPYTKGWLTIHEEEPEKNNEEIERTFAWPGTIGQTPRNVNTVPDTEGWKIASIN